VAVSLCEEEPRGTLLIGGISHIIQFGRRERREVEDIMEKREDEMSVESTRDGECGLNQRNKAKMKVGERPVVRLRRAARRSKRSTRERTIEVAVFVDDVMYNNVEQNKKPGSGTVETIQNIVFTYMNAVQHIYFSSKLDNRLRLVLVKLDIMSSAASDLDKEGGDIESYLENFCRWQKARNPGDWRTGDQDEAGHWDHALLLTGLDLYDKQPALDSVIGLAWVSGMCHPDYSCTINEGNNFESVFVIAHEMGHNLGMNHDGETTEGNRCSPDEFLMSPVLGPGKVTWSSCSNSELARFLTGPDTAPQATCLDDLPALMDLYDFTAEGLLPGEKFSALAQCQQAFGSLFKPHMQSQSPFEDLCRELWCSNSTHALRAHPALEGTDCKSTPYPYGSTCKSGACTPFNPNEQENEVGSETSPPPAAGPGAQAPVWGSETTEAPNIQRNEVDDSPAWYDPIYNQIFTDLRNKFKEKNPVLFMSHKDGMYSRGVEGGSVQAVLPLGEANTSQAAWHLLPGACPVPCGGGWTEVRPSRPR
jgi:hypothetical protein